MSGAILAAVCFEDGDNIDSLLKDIAAWQFSRGCRVRGVLQARGLSNSECYCSDMDLQVIGSDRVFQISQPLGQGSSGCRLHPGALAECSKFLEHQVDDGCDLLILNRFGKDESEGRGFRDLIGHALGAGIPVLTAVRATYRQSFEIFSADLGVELPFHRPAVENWFYELERGHAA